MNHLERIIQKTANLLALCENCHHNEAEAVKAEVYEEQLYLSRLAMIDEEEKRFREIQRDGRRAIRHGCE